MKMYLKAFHSADERPAAKRPRAVALGAAAFAAVMLVTPFAYARPAPDSFADLAAKVTPAVVNVSTTQEVERGPGRLPQMPFPPGSPFEEFFKRFFEEQNYSANPARTTALGSGFIVDPAGYVVTNNHVVGKASKIDVTLTDGRKFDAKLIGRDEKTDLALLKIEAERPLPFVDFGDSNAIRVGDWVMAVGNPFGLGGSVTAGIVSARGRDIRSGPYDDFLQIDAAINRGNSGGPTFDMNGAVVGVNTAIYSPNGGSVGIGFAIPSSIAKPVIAELREHGKVDRGWLGVQIQEVTPEIAAGLGMNKAEGALVAAVTPDSPAAKAGIKQGDVILGIDGKPVERLKDLTLNVANQKAGSKVALSVWRDGRTQDLQASIAQMPQEIAQAGSPASPERAETGQLGLALAPLTPELRQRFGLEDDVKGVVVTAVRPGSPAAEIGLRPGDVVKKVNQTDVTAPRQLIQQIEVARKDGRDAVLLLVARGDNQRFVALPVGKA
ncbi:MAG TPA: DegQ family serine endoprotease [Alphaproteobacteria bacterium]|nr:DegQ family serine endoprotease [Alphaproteobacteria bacterium]